MTLIQTLPVELFDPILKVYVDTVPLHESFCVRIVSRKYILDCFDRDPSRFILILHFASALFVRD